MNPYAEASTPGLTADDRARLDTWRGLHNLGLPAVALMRLRDRKERLGCPECDRPHRGECA